MFNVHLVLKCKHLQKLYLVLSCFLLFFVDSGIKICFNGASDLTRLSCCNSQMEQQYVIAAQKYLKDSVHAKNAYLKKLIIDHISEFEGKLLNNNMYL